MNARGRRGADAHDARGGTNDPRPLVLHVIHHLVMGGMENGLVNLINHMPSDRYRHAIACVEDYSDFRRRIVRDDVEVVALHRSRTGAWALRRSLFALCRRLRPAIVHSRNQSGLDALLPARAAGVRCNIHGEHGWDVDNLRGERFKPMLLRRLHSPLVDGYIVVSKDLQRYLAQRVGVAKSRITQIYNGVDTDRFAPGCASASRPPSQDDGHRIRIGTVGRLQAVKDQATLLRAFAAASGRLGPLRLQATLVIVGGGPLLAELRRLSIELGIANAVRFEGPVDDVPGILKSLDIFVLPSLNEGISNTLLEALSAGIPVIASAAGGNVEVVEDGAVGRLFPPGDIDALAALLTVYVDDALLRQRHGAAGRRLSVERFSLDAMVQHYLTTYDRLLASR